MKKALTSLLVIIVLVLNFFFQPSDNLQVHFIDVGQGDSILVRDGKEVMLIDAGTNGCEDLVVDYLRDQKIRKIDYLVGTHPHEDHIGGLDAVIDNFDIGYIYMPKVTHTTKTFKDVLESAKKKGLKISSPKLNTRFNLGDASCIVFAPNSDEYEGFNNYSIVIRLDYGENSFLFTGDAEAISEDEMLGEGYDLDVDVIKLGHHGSSTSSTEEFLASVSPNYAVISLGKDNKYGHPHKEVMARLKKRNIKVYRTDKNGTIIAESDGETITFLLEKGKN